LHHPRRQQPLADLVASLRDAAEHVKVLGDAPPLRSEDVQPDVVGIPAERVSRRGQPSVGIGEDGAGRDLQD
jgi:hypothetical protein